MPSQSLIWANSAAPPSAGVSQAGLSEQVRKLEAQLGVALFKRTTRRI